MNSEAYDEIISVTFERSLVTCTPRTDAHTLLGHDSSTNHDVQVSSAVSREEPKTTLVNRKRLLRAHAGSNTALWRQLRLVWVSVQVWLQNTYRVDATRCRLLDFVNQPHGADLRRPRHRAWWEGRGSRVERIEAIIQLASDGCHQLMHCRIALDGHEL